MNDIGCNRHEFELFVQSVASNFMQSENEKKNMVLVAVKYDQTIQQFNSDISYDFGSLKKDFDLCYCWKLFSNASKASLCAKNLMKMDITHFMREATKSDSSPLQKETGPETNETQKTMNSTQICQKMIMTIHTKT